MGELVTETFEYDGGRPVTVYVAAAERAGKHGGAFWRKEFPLMVAWAFGPAPQRAGTPTPGG
ncbi:MAG TPA: hypothetical protein VHW06_02005 [Streptosporangiaceae bacterium]|jgi:hypothetical protein|nr:hypothetical protein [Streptosporangiaceae bacterium]